MKEKAYMKSRKKRQEKGGPKNQVKGGSAYIIEESKTIGKSDPGGVRRGTLLNKKRCFQSSNKKQQCRGKKNEGLEDPNQEVWSWQLKKVRTIGRRRGERGRLSKGGKQRFWVGKKFIIHEWGRKKAAKVGCYYGSVKGTVAYLNADVQNREEEKQKQIKTFSEREERDASICCMQEVN